MSNSLRPAPVLKFSSLEIINYSCVEKFCGLSQYSTLEHLVTKFHKLFRLKHFTFLLITKQPALKLFLLFISFSTNNLYSQQNDSIFHLNTSCKVMQDKRIDDLLKKRVQFNEYKGTIEGYRVQIFIASGTHSKKNAHDAKALFLSKYPDIETYVVYHQPNFKVRAGNFRTKLDAHKLLNSLKRDYPGAFIVKDEISLPEL